MTPPDTAAARKHRHGLRVYWEDTDAGGIVFYANYLRYFERARTEWLRALGFEQQRMRETEGAIFVVTHASVHYRAPARLDDWLEVTVDLEHAGRASFELAQHAYRGDQLLAEGKVRVGCIDAATLRPCRIPNPILGTLA